MNDAPSDADIMEYLYRPRFSWLIVSLTVLCAAIGVGYWLYAESMFDWFTAGVFGIAAVLLLYATLLSRYGTNRLRLTPHEIVVSIPFTGAERKVAVSEITNVQIRTQAVGATAWFAMAQYRWLEVRHRGGKLNIPERYLPNDADLNLLSQTLERHLRHRQSSTNPVGNDAA